jgi:hypothetical protein
MRAKLKITSVFAHLRRNLECGRGAPSQSISTGVLTVTGGVAVVAVALILAAPASALSKHIFSTSFAGEGPTAISEPTDVAVDQSTGDVYVTDPANFRVEKFTASGEFLLMFGKEVNKKKVEEGGRSEAEQNVCGAGEECQPGTEGSSPGAFEIPESVAVDNSPGGGGDVYVGDTGDALVSKFTPSGDLITAWGSHGQLDGGAGTEGDFRGIPPEFPGGLATIAVSTRGILFVLGGLQGQIFRFAQDGTFLMTQPFTNTLEGRGAALDSAENLYLSARGILLRTSPTLEPGENNGINYRPAEKVLIRNGLPVYEVSGSIAEGPAGFTIDPTSRDLYMSSGGEHDVSQFSPSCTSESESCTAVETFGAANLSDPRGVAVDDKSGTVYVADAGEGRVGVFTAVPYLPEAMPSAAVGKTPTEELLGGEVDPAGAGEVTGCHFEYASVSAFVEGGAGWAEGTKKECSPNLPYSDSESTEVSAETAGLTYGSAYRLRLVVENGNGSTSSFDEPFTTLPLPPEVGATSVSEAYAETAKVHAQINPGGGKTTYRIEYVTQKQFEEGEFAGAEKSPELDAGSARSPQSLTAQLTHLTPGTTYHYRVLASNANKATTGPVRTFTTLSFASPTDPCPNAHVRQQTSAAGLLDCRAYELVSASNSGGYDVESDLVAGQTPLAGYPEANGRVLYGVHGGGIPGTNNPTNRGVDPYVAARGENGWSTEYVGIPSNTTPSAAPFASTLLAGDAGLGTFAFGGPEICQPCFADGSTGEPLHLPNGELIQGMAGSLNPAGPAEPAGYIAMPLSGNGEHFVFGSTSKFEPEGNEGQIAIYDRNLKTEETHVVSKAPGNEDLPFLNLPCLLNCETDGIAELAISKDGSHILIGQLVEEAKGAKHWHLYMNVGDSVRTIDLTPGAAEGVLFDGMTADGSKVFFSSEENLTNEDTSHSGADIFIWEEGHPLTLISRGNSNSCDPVANSAHAHWNTHEPGEENCGAVAIGGGGGVSSANGTIYFLSPEQLAGSGHGTLNAPNLYRAGPGDGYATHYVTTLESVLTGPQPPELRRSFLHDFPAPFTAAAALAVEHQSHNVYVLDNKTNTVEKFDSSGKPVDFTQGAGAGTNQLNGAETPKGSFKGIDESGFNLPTQLAVDNSTGSSKGDLYVPDLTDNIVDRFSSSGAYLGEVNVSFPTGVAVNSADGDVYVSGLFGNVSVFEPSAFLPEAPEPTTPSSSFSAGNPTSIAVDAGGTVYVTELFGGTRVYESGAFARTLDEHLSQTVAVDPSNGDVSVDEGNQVSQFDSSGNQLGAAFGSGDLSGSIGVTVDPEGNLYATTAGGIKVAAFGPFGLGPSPLIDSPVVLDSVSSPVTRHSADFQVTPNGNDAAIPSTLSLAGEGEETAGHSQVYRYDAPAGRFACASCTLTGEPSSAAATMAEDGLSLTEDGRVFFTTANQLVAADTDNKKDVYEWEAQGTGNCSKESPSFGSATGACLALISAGTSTFDSGLLGADGSGSDAYFFTRDSLATQDENGPTVKIYDAREDGGFPYAYPEVPCKASDECHGASSPAPPPLEVGSESGTPHNYGEKCKRGFVLKNGACVKKPKQHKHKHHTRGGKK